MKQTRLSFLIAIVILMAGGSASLQSNSAPQEFADIATLHKRGWEERSKGNFNAGEDFFRKAQRKLKDYRSRQLKDEASPSYLIATYRLGYLSELADKDKEARRFYLECLSNPSIKLDSAKADGAPISELAAKRLKVLEQRLAGHKKSSTDSYPRIRVSGGSKGRNDEDLPPRSTDIHP